MRLPRLEQTGSPSYNPTYLSSSHTKFGYDPSTLAEEQASGSGKLSKKRKYRSKNEHFSRPAFPLKMKLFSVRQYPHFGDPRFSYSFQLLH